MAIIEISDATDLQAMENDLYADYEIIKDIDASGTSTWNDGAGFDPVGIATLGNRFVGTLNGNSYEITDLYINRPTEGGVGLFGYVGSSCHLYDIVLKSVSFVGKNNCGGLLGYSFTSDIERCIVYGSITGENVVGGMVGNFQGHLKESVSEATVNGQDSVGGFCGRSYRPSAGTLSIFNCCSRGDVDGNDSVGGFIGDHSHGGVTPSTPYLQNCYSVGRVVAISNAGGFSGSGGSSAFWKYCFWDKDTSEQNASTMGVGRTTDVMELYYNYIHWDISPLPAPKEYPVLYIENENIPTVWGCVGAPVHYVHPQKGWLECPLKIKTEGELIEWEPLEPRLITGTSP